MKPFGLRVSDVSLLQQEPYRLWPERDFSRQGESTGFGRWSAL